MKIELVSFENGQYAIRKTERNLLTGKSISYYDLDTGSWKEPGGWANDCFTSDFNKAQNTFVRKGFAQGIPIEQEMIINISDFIKVSQASKTDEGLKDLLLQLKEFYLLKRK